MTDRLTHTVEQASAKLGEAFTVDWIRHHIDELPHGRTGEGTGRAGRIFFTDADLEQIVAMRAVRRPEPTRVGPVGRRRAS